MEPVITLSYPEHDVAEELSLCFSKFDNFTVSIMVDRLRATPNIVILHTKTRKFASFRIHTSKFYSDSHKDRQKHYPYNLRFKRIRDFSRESADYHILYGQFPRDDVIAKRTRRAKSPKSWWGAVMIIYSHVEMKELMGRVKQIPEFGFGFHHPDSHIYLTHGCSKDEDASFQCFGAVIPGIREELKK